MPKQDKKERKSRAVQKVLLKLPEDFDLAGKEIFLNLDGEKVVCPWEVRMVIPQLTRDEKDRQRRLSRSAYMRKPETVEKMKERMSRPDVIAKKKAYAEKPEVKLRKKMLAARSRKIRKEMKERDPEHYKQIEREVEEELRKTEKWIREMEALGNVLESDETSQSCEDSACPPTHGDRYPCGTVAHPRKS